MSSAIGRFHRGVSLALLGLAGLIIAIELLRHGHGTQQWVLSTAEVMVSLLAVNVGRSLLRLR